MRQSLWLYPTAESLHIVGIAIMVGGAAMFDLRLLGWSPQLSVTSLAKYLLPWSRVGFGLVALSGLLMFISDAQGYAANPVFQAKLVLILLAGLNIAFFHSVTVKSVSKWDRGVSPPLSAKLAAALSLAIWLGVILAGRFVAYV